MNPWDLDVNLRDVILDLLYLSTFLIIGTFLRRHVKFFQNFLIQINYNKLNLRLLQILNL